MEFSKIETFLENNYDSFTRIFNNWYIVVKEDDDYIQTGIIDSNLNTILSLEKGLIFANDRMIFINRKESFVWDSNGQYITEPEEDVFYKPLCGIHSENGHWRTFYPEEIIVYTFRGDDNYNLHLFVPGKQPSKDSICFRNIEKLNDHLFKFYNGEVSYWNYKIFGVINEFGNVVLPCNYQIISEQNGVFYFTETIYDDGRRYTDTAIDKNGHVLVNSKTCSDLQPLEDGYVIFRQKGTMGLFDPSFNIVIPAKYNELEFIKHNLLNCNSLYLVDYEDNPLIVENEELIKLPSEYCYAHCVGEKRYKVSKRDLSEGSARCGLINGDNNIVMPFIYDNIYSELLFNQKYIIFSKDGKSGIADMNGRILLENLYDEIERNTYIGTTPRYTRIWNFDENHHRLYGLLSSEFTEILPPIHQVMRERKDDIIVFMFNNIWGFYSFADNSTKILHGYTLMSDFHEGFCSVCQGGEFEWREKDEEYYTIDGYTIKERYASVTNGKWGAIDKKGHQVIPCIYDAILPFEAGMAIVRKDEKRGIVDSNGCIIVPLEYDGIECLYGVYIIKKEGLVGCVTIDKVFIDCKYTDINPIVSEDLLAVKEERAWGIINNQGEIIISPNYARIEIKNDGRYICYLDEDSLEYDIIDSAGKIVSSERIKEEKIDDKDDEFMFDPFDYDEDDDSESYKHQNYDCSEDIP